MVKAEMGIFGRYFAPGVKAGDVLVAQLRQVIFQVEGVANYRLGAPISDVAVEKDVLPVLGSLTVEEMV